MFPSQKHGLTDWVTFTGKYVFRMCGLEWLCNRGYSNYMKKKVIYEHLLSIKRLQLHTEHYIPVYNNTLILNYTIEEKRLDIDLCHVSQPCK